MKPYYILIIISTLISCRISKVNNENPIADGIIKVLNKNNIKTKNYQYVSSFEVKPYNKGYTETNNTDSLNIKQISLTLDNEYIFNTYEYIPTDYKKYHSEYFTLGKNKIFLDKVIQENHINLKYQNPYFYFRNSYIFKNDNDIILVLKSENRTFYRDREVKSIFYFYIKDGTIVDVRLFYDIKNDIYWFYSPSWAKSVMPFATS